MRRIALLVSTSISLFSQIISGIVVDSDGKPIEGVRIDNSTELSSTPTSGADGRFRVSVGKFPAILRKPGHLSQLVHASPANNLRVVLETASQKEFSVCKSVAGYESIMAGKPGLYFRVPDGISSGSGRDIDYAERTYAVKDGNTTKGIVHGRGPTWDLGVPSGPDVWSSIEYSEEVWETPYGPGVWIIGARGKMPNGKLWRYLGMPGESAFYRNVDEPTARKLDEVLDSACLLPR